MTIITIFVVSLFNFSDSSFYFLKKQVDFGPRNPGSESHRFCREFIIGKLKEYTDSVFVQEFVYKNILFYNIIGIKKGKNKENILLGTHYDTRPFAEMDPDTSRRKQPILGANDGASGVAVLLEIARILKKRKINKNIYFVFFDGEDFGYKDDALLGSKYFSENLPSKIDEVIIVDMIGDRDLQVYREGLSESFSKRLNDKVFKILKKIDKSSFFDNVKYYIYDDHIHFINLGIPSIVIIDFDYKFWHTTMDVIENCSAKSLKKIKKGLLKYILN